MAQMAGFDFSVVTPIRPRPFDAEEEQRRILEESNAARWPDTPVTPSEVNIAPEEAPVLAPLEQPMPGTIEPNVQAVLDENGEPPLPVKDAGGPGGPALPQADEDLPPVVAPGDGFDFSQVTPIGTNDAGDGGATGFDFSNVTPLAVEREARPLNLSFGGQEAAMARAVMGDKKQTPPPVTTPEAGDGTDVTFKEGDAPFKYTGRLVMVPDSGPTAGLDGMRPVTPAGPVAAHAMVGAREPAMNRQPRLVPDGGQIVFDQSTPERFAEGVERAFQSGLLPQANYEKIKANTTEIFKVVEDRRKLEAKAQQDPRLLAFLQGAGRGGAMTLGAVGGAQGGVVLGAMTGPAAPVAMPVLATVGGIGGGIAAGIGYDALYKQLGKHFDQYETVMRAAELYPQYTQGGELSMAAVALPVSVAQGARGLMTTAQGAGGLPAAARQAGAAAAAGAGTGVVAYPIDAAVRGEEITPGGFAAAAAAGAAMGGFFINNRVATQNDLAAVAAKMKAGMKLSAAEAELAKAAAPAVRAEIARMDAAGGVRTGPIEVEVPVTSVSGFMPAAGRARARVPFTVPDRLPEGALRAAQAFAQQRRMAPVPAPAAAAPAVPRQAPVNVLPPGETIVPPPPMTPAMMTPDDFATTLGTERGIDMDFNPDATTELFNEHFRIVREAINANQPVSAAALDLYEMRVPYYVRDEATGLAVFDQASFDAWGKYVQGQEREARDDMRQGGVDLLDAIRMAGGLPTAAKGNNKAVWGGELRRLQEMARGARDLGIKQARDLFRKDANDVDRVVMALRAEGFKIETESDLFELLEQRLRSGKPMFAYGDGRAGATDDMPAELRGRRPVAKPTVATEMQAATALQDLHQIVGKLQGQLSIEDNPDGLDLPDVTILETDFDGVELQVEHEAGSNTLYLRRLEAHEMGKGAGTRFLQTLRQVADKHGVAIVTDPMPMGETSERRLKAWYKRNGFLPKQGQYIYAPKPVAESNDMPLQLRGRRPTPGSPRQMDLLGESDVEFTLTGQTDRSSLTPAEQAAAVQAEADAAAAAAGQGDLFGVVRGSAPRGAVKVYRGELSDLGGGRQLTGVQDIGNLMGLQDQRMTAPFEYYTTDVADAERYAARDQQLLSEYATRFGQDQALRVFETLHGHAPRQGRVESFDITPTNTFDMTSMGVQANQFAMTELAARTLGYKLPQNWRWKDVPEAVNKELEDFGLLVVGNPDEPVPTWSYFRNDMNMIDADMIARGIKEANQAQIKGNLFAQWLDKHGFDSVAMMHDTPTGPVKHILMLNRAAMPVAQQPISSDPLTPPAQVRSGGGAKVPPGAVPVGMAAVGPPDWVLQPGETSDGRRLIKGIQNFKRGQRWGFRTIVDHVNRAVRLEMRKSRSQTSKVHPAHYNPAHHLAFTRDTQSQINFHEAGHGLEYLVRARVPDFFKAFETELIGLTKRPGSMASEPPSGLSPDQAQSYRRGEGVAEWTRLLMTDPASVQNLKVTPALSAAAEQYYPGMAKALRDGARAVHAFQQKPVAERWAMFNAQANLKPNAGETIGGLIRMGENAVAGLSSGAPVSKLDRTIRRAILKQRKEVGMTRDQAIAKMRAVEKKNLTPLLAAYNMILSIGAETQLAISGQSASKGLRAVGPDGKFKHFTKDTWRDLRRKVPAKQLGQFDEAAWALESLNRWKTNKLEYPGMREGVTPTDLEAIVTTARVEIKNFDALFAEQSAFHDAVLDLKDFGRLLKPGERDRITDARDTYWPLPRVMQEGRGRAGKGGGEMQTGVYRARGSGEAIRQIDEVTEERVRTAFEAYYWNRFGLTLVNSMQRVATDKSLPIEARSIAGSAIVQLKMPMKAVASVSADEVKPWVLEAVADQLEPLLGFRPDLKPDDINLSWNFKDIWRPVKPDDVNVVSLLRDGEREYYQLGDPAIFGMFANPQVASKAGRFLSWALGPMTQNWKRQITQGPVFAIRNLFRDIFTQTILNPDPIAWIPGGTHILGTINKFTQKYPQVFSEGLLMSRVEPSETELVNTIRHGAVWQWFSEGFYVSQAKDPVVKILATVLQPSNWLFPAWKLGDVFNLVTGGRTLAEFFETAGREGAAVSVLRRGGTDEEALMKYWSAAGQFNEHPGVADARIIMNIPGFLNPMFQGVRNAMQKLSDPDPGVRATSWTRLLVMMPMMFGGAAVASYLMMRREDRDKERQRPVEDRMNFMDIYGFSVPFPYGPEGVMGSVVYNAVMDDLLSRPVEDADKTAWMLLRRIGDPGSPMQFFGPQLATLMEAGMNWSNYRQRNIVSPWMVNLPPSEQYYSTTPEFYRKIGQMFNYSPAKLQYITQQAISRQADETVRMLEAMDGGRPMQESADVPFVGRLFVRDPIGFGSQAMRNADEVEGKLRLLNTRLNAKGYGVLAAFDRDGNPEYPADKLGSEDLVRLQMQLGYLQGLRQNLRQIEDIQALGKTAALAGNFALERNLRRASTIRTQSVLMGNKDEIRLLDQALELVNQIPVAPPEQRAADYMQRRF